MTAGSRSGGPGTGRVCRCVVGTRGGYVVKVHTYCLWTSLRRRPQSSLLSPPPVSSVRVHRTSESWRNSGVFSDLHKSRSFFSIYCRCPSLRPLLRLFSDKRWFLNKDPITTVQCIVPLQQEFHTRHTWSGQSWWTLEYQPLCLRIRGNFYLT